MVGDSETQRSSDARLEQVQGERLLTTTLTPKSGTATIDGLDISARDDPSRSWASRCGAPDRGHRRDCRPGARPAARQINPRTDRRPRLSGRARFTLAHTRSSEPTPSPACKKPSAHVVAVRRYISSDISDDAVGEGRARHRAGPGGFSAGCYCPSHGSRRPCAAGCRRLSESFRPPVRRRCHERDEEDRRAGDASRRLDR